ncbi:unnamed protein product, partial [Amoebophrya sp. A25]
LLFWLLRIIDLKMWSFLYLLLIRQTIRRFLSVALFTVVMPILIHECPEFVRNSNHGTR